MGPEFYYHTLQAADLDEHYPPTNEFEDSLTIPLNHPNGERIRRIPTDVTNFLPIIQLERSGDGRFFDGLETGNRSVSLGMKFNPIHEGENDVYLYHTQAAPILLLVRDTFWSIDSKRGLVYYRHGTPEMYASDQDRIDNPGMIVRFN